MIRKDFEAALRAFTRRRPFQPFQIEFLSGDRVAVSHPEAVREYGNLFVHVRKGQGYRLFVCDSVCQILDVPAAPVS